jgi:hypothetical protein
VSELSRARTPTKRDLVALQHFRPLGSHLQATLRAMASAIERIMLNNIG